MGDWGPYLMGSKGFDACGGIGSKTLFKVL